MTLFIPLSNSSPSGHRSFDTDILTIDLHVVQWEYWILLTIFINTKCYLIISNLKKMSVALDCTLCVVKNYTYCTVFVSVWNNAITEKLVICVQGIGPSVSNDLTWSNACHVVLLTINISLFLISLFFFIYHVLY